MKAHLRVGVFVAGGAMMLAGCSSTSDVDTPTPSPAVSASATATTRYVLSKDFCRRVPFEYWRDVLGKPSPDFGPEHGTVKGQAAECAITVQGGQAWIRVSVTLLRGELTNASPVAGEAILRDSSALAEVVAKARPQDGPKRCGSRVVDGNAAIEVEVLRLKGGDPEAAVCERMRAFLLEVLHVLPVIQV